MVELKGDFNTEIILVRSNPMVGVRAFNLHCSGLMDKGKCNFGMTERETRMFSKIYYGFLQIWNSIYEIGKEQD